MGGLHALGRHPRLAALLALVAGAALPLAFAPLGWWPLALLSPVVLFLLAAELPARAARWAAWCYGIGYFGAGVSWVYVSIHQFGGAPPLLAGLTTAAFVLALALFPVLLVESARRLARPGGAAHLWLALPAVWVALEWLRGWLFTGFPWLLLGYSQLDTPWVGWAPVFGVLGMSAWLALLAGGLACALRRPQSPRHWGVVAGLAVAFGVGGWALDREWTAPAGEPLRVAMVQGNMGQDIKWLPEYLVPTLERYRDRTLPHAGVADVVIWPETAVPAFLHQVDEDWLSPLADALRAQGTELVVGLPVYASDRDAIYNSLVAFGETRQAYHKHHLVPFGEYVPLRDWLGGTLDVLGAPLADFTRGPRPVPLTVQGQPVGVAICYEVVYGATIARLARESRWLVNVSNDAWFGQSLAPHQHLQKARWRAREVERPMVRATNTGISAFIDHDGGVAERLPRLALADAAQPVQGRDGLTPYARWLNGPVVGLVLLVMAGLAGWRWWRRPG
ncbi:apolipoprotein N-acyltransferase [Alkalilimnicola ehrlichii MLHE-1]|uniref:Apolipoprotein N-acyltransferase n=1 Tax=Alkalilimnicola ehrlichii (strain ATCC BAA-1101 / DSM 17681 / MLHE-1) TaxID=187272 RepID=Q0ABN5_ALKEH|nr:apolipoprotein N-acyltransferase [Alkalilimnicola ehrlichii]ABI55752.1 apolipoprotein N-acyltransferase [Alkalilimnicola ehrlichii MLHE-1]